MRRGLSIGFVIFSLAAFALWTLIAVIHFFKHQGFNSDVWFYTFINVQRAYALTPGVIIVLGLSLVSSAFHLLPHWKKRVGDFDLTATGVWSLALLTATASWVVVALINMFLFANPEGLVIDTMVKWYLAIFEIFADLAIGNYILTIAFFLLAGVFGRAVIKKIWPTLDFASRLQEFLFSTATGFGLIALGLFCIGLVNLLYPWIVLVFFLVVFATGYVFAPKYIPDMLQALSEIHFRDVALALFIILLLFIISGLHTPLFPPYSHDVMNSHLEAPKVFIRDHAIDFHAYINFNNFPMGVEMLYIPALMLNRDVMTRITTFFFFLMCIGVVYEFGRAYLGSPILGFLSAIILCLTPKFVQQSATPSTDMALAFYIAVSGLALAGFLYAGRDKYPALAGILLGFALGIKYTALLFVLFYAVWIIIQRFFIDRTTVKRTVIPICIFVLLAALVACPWYIRNVVLFGNPVFPFYDTVFSKVLNIGTLKELKPDLMVDEAEMLEGFEYKGDMDRGYKFLVDLSFGTGTGIRSSIGPLYIAILPFLILFVLTGIGRLLAKYVFRWPTEIHWDFPALMCLAMVVFYSLYWVFLAEIIHVRYFSPAVPFMAILAGYVLHRLLQFDRLRIKHIITYMLFGILGILALLYFNAGINHLKVSQLPLGKNSRDVFLAERLTGYDAIKYANEDLRLGPEDIVYGLGCEDCRYYADFTLIGGQWGYADWRDFNEASKTGEELYEYLKGFGCSYLIYDTSAISYLAKTYERINLPSNKDETFKQHFEQVYKDKFAFIYKIE